MSVSDLHENSGATENRIVCRTCRESIPVAEGTCPHCGTAIRSQRSFLALVGFGALLLLGSAFDVANLWLFALAGAGMVFAGGYFLKDRRDRLARA